MLRSRHNRAARIIAVVAVAILGVCAAAPAAIIPPTTMSMQSLLDSGGSFLIGDKLYSNFTFQSTGDAPLDAQDVNVTFSSSDGNHYNVRFSFGLDAFPSERTDVLIGYQIDVTGTDYINRVGLDFNGNVPSQGPGNAAASVTETISTLDGSDLSPGAPITDTEQISVFSDGPNRLPDNLASSLPVNLTRSLQFVKDIIVSSRPTGGVATISFVDNSVDQVPEPSSLGLLFLAGAASLLRRRA